MAMSVIYFIHVSNSNSKRREEMKPINKKNQNFNACWDLNGQGWWDYLRTKMEETTEKSKAPVAGGGSDDQDISQTYDIN